jgi:hypothetical protein
MKRLVLFSLLTATVLLPACGDKETSSGDAGTDTDTDTDSDTGVCSEPADSPVDWFNISDDFDSYNVDDKIAEVAGPPWIIWDYNAGGPLDPAISDAQALSGSNSLLIEAGDDLVLHVGKQAEGVFQIDFQVYLETGRIGYFSILQRFWSEDESSGNAMEYIRWGVDVFFDDGGTGVVMAAGLAPSFDYTPNAWVPVSAVIDLDTNEGTMTIDGTEVATWPWNLGSTGENDCQRLGGINFYGNPSDSNNDDGDCGYYVDDVSVTNTDTVVCDADNVAICDAAYADCQVVCDETDPTPECYDACFTEYCDCIISAGCDPADYDCS